MNLFRSPGRTLANIVLFNLTVVVIATFAYMWAGWDFGDAFYIVLLSVYASAKAKCIRSTTPISIW